MSCSPESKLLAIWHRAWKKNPGWVCEWQRRSSRGRKRSTGREMPGEVFFPVLVISTSSKLPPAPFSRSLFAGKHQPLAASPGRCCSPQKDQELQGLFPPAGLVFAVCYSPWHGDCRQQLLPSQVLCQILSLLLKVFIVITLLRPLWIC